MFFLNSAVVFFLVYLLSHNIGRRTRQGLILLCEIHFTLLYILRIDLILKEIEKIGSSSVEILSQLGKLIFLNENKSFDSTLMIQEKSYLMCNCAGLLHYDGWDFFEIAFLACFCAIHNHGFNMLFSFSAVVQHSPCPPMGFGILKAGLNKSVLLSVYASQNSRNQERTSSGILRFCLLLLRGECVHIFCYWIFCLRQNFLIIYFLVTTDASLVTRCRNCLE